VRRRLEAHKALAGEGGLDGATRKVFFLKHM
jgi:hypothetical protein